MVTITINNATGNISPHQQLLDKASAELQANAKKKEEIQARLASIDAERASIDARMQQRAQERYTLQETANSHQIQLATLTTQAKLAQGTLAEGQVDEQIRTLTGKTNKTAKAIQGIQAHHAQLDEKDQARFQALYTSQQALQQQITEIEGSLATLEQVMQEAWAALGMDIYHAIQQEREQIAAKIEASQATIAAAEQELAALTQGAMERLSQWPDLAQKLSESLPYHDATTRVLTLAITLLDALLHKGKDTSLDTDLLRQVSPWSGHVLELLALDLKDIWPISTHRVHEARTIRDRKQKLERLLALHRQQKMASRAE